MTLEASLIVPMVICVFALLIYFSYYLYGRCMLTQDCYVLSFRASVSKDLEPAAYVEDRESSVAGEKYFGSTDPDFSVAVQGDEVRVSALAEANHSAMGNYFLKPKDGWEYEAAKTATKREYSKHIRMLTRIRDIGKGLLDRGEDK